MGKSTLSFLFGKLNWREKILFSLLAAGAVAEDILVETLHPLNIKAAYYDYSPETVAYIKGRSKTLRNVLAQLVARKMVEVKGREGLWGKILVFKASLPLRESRRLARLFWPTVSQKSTGNITEEGQAEGAVSRLLADPLLPVNFPVA